MAGFVWSQRIPTPEEIRDALLALPENERSIVITDPSDGKYRVIAVRRNAAGHFEYDYQDEE